MSLEARYGACSWLERRACEDGNAGCANCFRWEPNSIAIWDNRSVQHKPVNDFFPGYWKMERVVINGDRPY